MKQKIYQCTFNGCNHTSTTEGDRHQHGKAQVEMRQVVEIGSLAVKDSLVSKFENRVRQEV